MNILGTRLKELRVKKNLKQDDLSVFLHIARSTYSYYESGKSSPNPDTILKLANYYDVTTDYLLGNTDLAISPTEMNFINDINLENEELMKKYNLLIGDHTIEPEALAHWIAILKINLKKRD